MNNYYFYVKKGIDLSKYGFVEEKDEWVIYGSVKKLRVKKQSMKLIFNTPASKELKIFADMVKDNAIEIYHDNQSRKCYPYSIQLTEEEFDLIMEMRKR